MIKIEYFKIDEFASKDKNGNFIPGSGQHMRVSTLLKCDQLRENFGKVLIVASGYRTPERNKMVGGVKNSSHLLGYAVDFFAISNEELVKFLDAAWDAGFRRFGIMAANIHVDDDPSKGNPAIWTYDNTPPQRFAIAQRWFEKKRNV